MKKFALLTIGFEKPTPQIMEEWMKWFQSIQPSIIEQVGFMNGKEITENGLVDLEMNLESITGCLFIQAESMEDALKIAEGCPMITSTRVYEVREQKS